MFQGFLSIVLTGTDVLAGAEEELSWGCCLCACTCLHAGYVGKVDEIWILC